MIIGPFYEISKIVNQFDINNDSNLVFVVGCNIGREHKMFFNAIKSPYENITTAIPEPVDLVTKVSLFKNNMLRYIVKLIPRDGSPECFQEAKTSFMNLCEISGFKTFGLRSIKADRLDLLDNKELFIGANCSFSYAGERYSGIVNALVYGRDQETVDVCISQYDLVRNRAEV